MRSLNYYNKIIILFIATFANIFIMWYFLIRQDSVDWISSQILHQVSPYAVTTTDDGEVIVGNVIIGYEFILPRGFKTAGARNLSFYLEENGRKKCEIRHLYVNAKKAKQDATTTEKIVIPFNNTELIFELSGDKENRANCSGYLEQIKENLTAV